VIEEVVRGILAALPAVTDYVKDLHRRSDTDILTERLRLRAITGCLIERMVHARIATLIETPAALSQLETALAGSVGKSVLGESITQGSLSRSASSILRTLAVTGQCGTIRG
jgi:hypothetical protein